MCLELDGRGGTKPSELEPEYLVGKEVFGLGVELGFSTLFVAGGARQVFSTNCTSNPS